MLVLESFLAVALFNLFGWFVFKPVLFRFPAAAAGKRLMKDEDAAKSSTEFNIAGVLFDLVAQICWFGRGWGGDLDGDRGDMISFSCLLFISYILLLIVYISLFFNNIHQWSRYIQTAVKQLSNSFSYQMAHYGIGLLSVLSVLSVMSVFVYCPSKNNVLNNENFKKYIREENFGDKLSIKHLMVEQVV